jgi:hypothetical protein
MDIVCQTVEIEPSFEWRNKTDIFVGARIPPQVARQYANHSFSLPVQHVTARDVTFDPGTAMVFHDGAPLPWSCFFGPYDPRVPRDCAEAWTRAGNECLDLRGRRVYCGFNRHHQNYAHCGRRSAWCCGMRSACVRNVGTPGGASVSSTRGPRRRMAMRIVRTRRRSMILWSALRSRRCRSVYAKPRARAIS